MAGEAICVRGHPLGSRLQLADFMGAPDDIRANYLDRNLEMESIQHG